MRALLLALLVACASALAQEKAPTVRPEVGKPLQEAIDSLKQRKGKEALAHARTAQAVPSKTPYETYLVTRVLGQAAAAAGDYATAASALENAANSPVAPEGDRVHLLAAAAGQYYTLKEYGKAAAIATKYFQYGGTDKAIRTIYVQSLYLAGNYGAAARELASDVEAETRAGKNPGEEQLQLLANAYLQSKDSAGYARTMEQLVALYPKREYWLAAIDNVVRRSGFNDRLQIDVARLKSDLGILRSAGEYLDFAQMSLIEGFPAEATRVIDKGYSAGVLGTGPDAARHKRLKDLAAKNLAEDRKAIAEADKQDTAGKDAKDLFNDGFNLVLNEKSAKGLSMMERALKQANSASSGFKRPDHAKLQLGYAYHIAGQQTKALEMFKSVQGTDGAAALARLWVIKLSRAS
ncbi:MAG TPA: hypothetical protein VEU32_10245 [Burkholderiales bacterium]|nr:hypothetical protein [Burkholderiales bacterium]